MRKIPFWFLNGDLRRGEMERQLRDFRAHGIDGVVLHPRIGLPKRIGYLSGTFFYYIRAAVETAAALGMCVVLYDEGMYPSGSACGQVVAGHPELASEGILLVSEEAVRDGDEVLACTQKGKIVARKSGGTIRGIHYGEDDGEPDAPLSADILNPAAVRRFIQLTHEQYYQNLKQYFGNTVIGFFTDEPSVLGRSAPEGMLPWTRGFAADFTAAGGDLSGLAALFSGGENSDTRLYHKMLLEREGEVYYSALSGWCEAHGVALMGHPHRSDDIELERYFHIPGQDLVLRWVAPEKGGLCGIDSTMAKCSADAARLFGRRYNSNECFGGCNRDGIPWNFSGADMKWYLDWLAVRGVNLFIPHAFYYSIAGKRRDERPPDVGPNNIWWPHYQKWSAYMDRLSALMTDIELRADIAVLCRNRDLRPEAVAPLFEHQIGFQYIPESFWPDCRAADGALFLQGRRYTAVIGDGALFPDVPHIDPSRDADRLTPDCVCEPPQPMLRAAHFTREGRECWLLVNEGEEAIRAKITFPTERPVCGYDIWSDSFTCFGEESEAVKKLDLPRRGSMLFFTCTPAERAALPAPVTPVELPCPAFALVKDEHGQKTYEAALTVTEEILAHGDVRLTVDADEMAELTVNGQFAGVEFWSPHTFHIRQHLREGENVFLLTVTGLMV